MFGKITFVCLVTSMIMLPFAATLAGAEAVNSPEWGLLNEANECGIKKDYQGVANILEKLLALYPDTRNEDVYFKLGDVYDNNLGDYVKAISIYQKYLQFFPEGRFFDRFKERLVYLEKNKDNWEIIKRYRLIQNTFYTRSEIENVKMMSELLNQNPNLYLKSDIYRWLANECLYLQQPGRALDYMGKYLATFPRKRQAGQ